MVEASCSSPHRFGRVYPSHGPIPLTFPKVNRKCLRSHGAQDALATFRCWLPSLLRPIRIHFRQDRCT